ncbi:MAG TPA: tetratricopeptide repeat protein [Edaphocola sp.]|nr:tetratricopeptide repeat protein [Edaphocola sp.]
MVKFYLLLILTFISFFCNGQVYQKEKDSINRLVAKSKGDEKAKLIINLSYYYVNTNKDSALILMESALEFAQSIEGKSKVYLEISNFHQYFNEGEFRLQALNTALDLVEGVNDSMTANILSEKNMIFSDKGLYNQALISAHKVLRIYEKGGNNNSILDAMLQIGYVYDRMGNYHTAIEWYKKGLKLNNITNENLLGKNYGLIGIAYDELKDYQKAIKYNLIAVEHFKNVPNSNNLSTWYSNLGNTYTKLGKLDLAESYTLLAIKDPLNFSPFINLATIYIEKGELEKAEKILLKKVEELKIADNKKFLAEANYRLFELNKKKGNYLDAIKYLEDYKTIEDERLAEKNIKQVNELTVQYETQEKEKMIFEQQNKINANQLELKNRYFWILGLSSLAIILGLLGFIFYRRQIVKSSAQLKDNILRITKQELQYQNNLTEQRTEIARDLHDNIGAHLTFIISSLENIHHLPATENRLVSNKITQLSMFTKGTIRELRDSIWAINKDAISLQDLNIRIANFIESANLITPQIKLNINTDTLMQEEVFFTSNAGVNIYRILQEAVNNAIKHAKAKNILINIKKENDILILEVEDDGIGYDFQKNESSGNGMQNMKRRSNLLKGNLVVTSLNPGTLLSCSFQCSELKK